MNIPSPIRTVVLSAAALLASTALSAQGTLERIAERGELRIGFNPDARPLSFVENGEAAGYSVDLCRRVAAEVREHLNRPDLKVAYVPVTLDQRFDAVANGDVDIECGSTTITLGRQERVDFTMMTFITGGTVLSTAKKPIPTFKDLSGKRVAVIRDTSTESGLKSYLSENRINARVVAVANADEGMAQLQRGDVDAYASDQVVLIGDVLKALDADKRADFTFADDLFSYEPYALMVQRNDAAFRLVANRALADLYRTGQFARYYEKWIGSVGLKPAPMLVAIYQAQSLAD